MSSAHQIARRIFPNTHTVSSSNTRRVMIDILPDDVLLCIFYFVRPKYDRLWDLSWWQPIAHVCRRWRIVVFASPNFLELRLVCDPWIPAGLTAIWPPIPIIIWNLVNEVDRAMPEDYDLNAAIVHPNRVCEIHLHFASSQLQRLAAAMQQPFPALVQLTLETLSDSPPPPVLPDGFLGGSAPRLQYLELNRIPFPTLPGFLLSATNLVHLNLRSIPESGYISPGVIVTHLVMLANLESLYIDFETPLSLPDIDSRRPLLPTRTVLPALTCFQFYGTSYYLEDLVARIDAPLLNSIQITYCHLLISDIPQLAQFMKCTTRFQTLHEAHVDLSYCGLVVRSHSLPYIPDKKSGFIISCVDDDWQFSFLEPVFVAFFPSIFKVENLYIHATALLHDSDDLEDMQLLEIFPAFATVKNIYVHMEFAELFAPILQGLVGEIATDVLPALGNLCLAGVQPSEPLREALGQLVSARRLIGHPVTISYRNWVEEV